MKLGYNLTLEQTQKLIMTPELRQAIQLLQFNSLELNEYIKKEMEENPMLEMENPSEGMERIEELPSEKEIDWKEYVEKYDDISYKPQVDKNQEKYNLESFISYSPSLKEYLVNQLNLVKLSEEEYDIGEYIIQNIDENGYLFVSTEEIAYQLEIPESKVEEILKVIQTFDPLGVGARDLKECLLIQIKEKGDIDPLIVSIIEEYLDDLACNRMLKISKELNIDVEKMQGVCDYIRTLEPKPGRAFSSGGDNVRYIVPDATIELIDGEFIILINDNTGPRLNINSFYRNLISNSSDKDATNFLSEKLNSAMWIIKSIEQRRQTIYKVVESILKFQIEFFRTGDKALVPLTLKDVADDIEMHESTISRATNGKYVQTPRGLYELKYFFTTGLPSAKGDISSTSIKSIIKDIIDNEDPKKPYSDQSIADILKTKGAKISRRTVAKYRDELEIPSSSMRRRFV
ncbi:RNA polymerase factor sigma-54 [Tissierellaceae bacterium HCP3S3_D8]